ncbi:hypothetical protein ACNUDN_11815 [Mycobacterium sp. smrl_JER01]|uniref:hypothetical protein n=1 Tax=Mycobacterium sp. smrl_JER01 TaxID=3402633 RepID=UPI003ACE1AE1
MAAPTLGTLTTEINSSLRPIIVDAPPVNPSPNGLWAATTWTDIPADQPSRFLTGVLLRQRNFDGLNAAGIWGAHWCANPDDLTDDDIKDGFRTPDLLPFDAYTMWGYDECDLTAPSRTEVRERAAQALKLNEQQMLEREFAARLLADAGTPATAPSITKAVGRLEGHLANAGLVGVIHAGAHWAAPLAEANLLRPNGSGYRSPMGHLWVLGGGYVDGLTETLVATAPVYGWRDQPTVRTTVKADHNLFVAVAERSIALAYEHSHGAVAITG